MPTSRSFAVLVHQGDEGHALLVVDIHQLVEQRRTGFLDLAEEAEVAGRRGQPVDELAFTLPVLLAQGTDQHVAAIVEGLDPVVALHRRERRRPAGILYIGHDAISVEESRYGY